MPAGQRIILITGVTRGLGRAMAERCIEAGHIVWGCGRSPEQLAELESSHPTPHRFHSVDVSSDHSVAAWARSVLKDGAAPDLILNNAAVINRNAPLWKVSPEEFDRVIDINIKGIANVIRHFVPAMVSRKSGVIVNFSSGWGRSTSSEVAPYCATKFAVEGLTLALAQELPQGMAAIPMNPGVINTDMLQSCFGKSAHSYPDAEEWSRTAVPYLLQLTARDNGKQLTCP